MKSINVYEVYDRHTKTVYQVAAYTTKQAAYLASRREWYGQGKLTGVLATGNLSNWSRWDGVEVAETGYRHGTTFVDGIEEIVKRFFRG